MVALDHKGEIVVDHGWEKCNRRNYLAACGAFITLCSGFLATFVEGEGCLNGMDLDAIKSLKKKIPGQLTVAGGIAETDEIVPNLGSRHRCSSRNGIVHRKNRSCRRRR